VRSLDHIGPVTGWRRAIARLAGAALGLLLVAFGVGCNRPARRGVATDAGSGRTAGTSAGASRDALSPEVPPTAPLADAASARPDGGDAQAANGDTGGPPRLLMPVLGFPPERLVRSFDRVSRPRPPPRRVVAKRVTAGKRKRGRRSRRTRQVARVQRARSAPAAATRPLARHEAIDILAPRYTPVVAVDDGTVAKLFYSRDGGITVYHFDPQRNYCYYYAHLQTYAEDLKEGDALKRGQVIGYVGTSGNAPPNTPHLHFAVHVLTPEKVWYRGTPIDPYDLLR
jgi:murein DD-endopeptidase MepM/ murein hydrolase activator NlpD